MSNTKKLQAFENKNKFWKNLFYSTCIISLVYFILLKVDGWLVKFPINIGNFNILFLLFTICTGVIFVKYLFSWRKDPEFIEICKGNRIPPWLEWSFPFFPWLALYCIIRLFLYEPFIIPSGSMRPTLEVKTLVFVNKFDRVILNPFTNNHIKDTNPVQRGDILVFKFPLDNKISYIKRVVGIPGDTISWNYNTEILTINGIENKTEFVTKNIVQETMPSTNGNFITHLQLKRLENSKINYPDMEQWKKYVKGNNCIYNSTTVTCKIPNDNYFMMGDNRNESADSRFWGLLEHKNIIGRATAQFDIFNLKVGKI